MLDKFGIKKLYPTIAGGREYYINMNATTLTQLLDNGRVGDLPANTKRNSDGSWRILRSETPRWTIRTPAGVKPWRNVEFGGRFRLIDPGLGSYLQLYARGARHSTDPQYAWLGTAIKGRLKFDGSTGFIEERYHDGGKVVPSFDDSGYTKAQGYTQSGIGSILNKWVSWKLVLRNQDNNTHVRMENWIDTTGHNDFKSIKPYVDTGNWPSSSNFPAFMTAIKKLFTSKPPIPYNQDTGQEMKINDPITWAGPYLSVRSDHSTYDFKDVSGREIAPLP